MTNVVKVLYIEAGRTPPDNDVLLQANFDDGDARDISLYEATVDVQDNWTFEGGRAKNNSGVDQPNNIRYNSTGIDEVANADTKSYTFECRMQTPAGGPLVTNMLIFGISDASLAIEIRVFLVLQTTSDYRKLYINNGGTTVLVSTGLAPVEEEWHFCFMFRGTADGGPHLWVFINGALAGELDGNNAFRLPNSGATVTIGAGPAVVPMYWDDVRLKLGLVYDTAGFEPPASLDDPRGVVGTARFVERSVQWQNLANIESREGNLAGETFKFHGFSRAENAEWAASRIGKTLSYPLAALRMVANRDAWQLRPGSVAKLNWPPLGIYPMISRASEIRYEELRS